MKKSKGLMEIPLAEGMIQHIQSFMSREEAARSSILSKSWYSAWLTHPTLDLGGDRESFVIYAAKRIRIYQELGLKIECFKLRARGLANSAGINELIISAMKIGATALDVEFPRWPCSLVLPQEVLLSETLVTLSLNECTVKGNHVVIRCSSLKSLTLATVTFESRDGSNDTVFKDVITCCRNSLLQLSLDNIRFNLRFTPHHLDVLPKLTRLALCRSLLHDTLFTDFASRFPCLKALSIMECRGWKRINVASTSLQTITFDPYPYPWSWRAKFDVPNIHNFTFLGSASIPQQRQLSIHGALREWEFDVSAIDCGTFALDEKLYWFLQLKKFLAKNRPSRITLSLQCDLASLEMHAETSYEAEVIKVMPDPLVLENLTINAPSSLISYAILVRLFGICRPKFLTHYIGNGSLHDDHLCKRLLIPNQSLFARFKLNKVKVEAVYVMLGSEWQPLGLTEPLDAAPPDQQKIRFQLIWEEEEAEADDDDDDDDDDDEEVEEDEEEEEDEDDYAMYT